MFTFGSEVGPLALADDFINAFLVLQRFIFRLFHLQASSYEELCGNIFMVLLLSIT